MGAVVNPGEIVGRERELGKIAQLLDRTEEGAAAIVLEGEPGIGKTTLWSAGVELARERGDRVLEARPLEAERDLSFAALADLLGSVGNEIERLPSMQRRALQIALLEEEPREDAPGPRLVATALRELLRLVNADGPLLLAIDDIQWLDSASAVVLQFALRRAEHESIRVLVTWRRGTERRFRLDWEERVEVSPLPRRLLAGAVRRHVGRHLTRPTLLAIADASGGNPFYALELARAFDDRDGALTVPPTLRALVLGRLNALFPGTREMLLYAAALAHPTTSQLEETVGDPGQIALALEEAAAADIITFAGDEVRFTHPLFGSVQYWAAPPRRRQEAHRRLAEVAADIEQRAHHRALAVQAPDPSVADALEDAARRAFERGAVEGAASLGERAVVFTPEERLDALQRRRLVAAGYLARAGSLERARELIEDARYAAPTGAQKARMTLALAWWGLGETSELVDALMNALADARADARVLAEVHAVLAAHLCPHIDIAAAADHASRALALAEAAGDSATLVMSLVGAARVDFYAGRGVGADQIARALALEAAAPNPYGEIGLARWFHSFQLLVTGELDAARRSIEALAAEGQGRADAGYADFLRGLAMIEIRAGNWERAQQLASEALELVREVGDVLGEAFCHEALVQLGALRGDVANTRTLAAEGIRLAELKARPDAKAAMLAALGMMELSLGDAKAAGSHLDETARLVAAMGIGEPGIVPFVPDRVEALVALGELHEAEAAAAQLLEQGRRLARGVALSGAARCHGLIALARGDVTAAEAALENACDEVASLGQPFEEARNLLTLGTVLRRARKRTAARQVLGQALAAFDRVGAAQWATRTREELSGLGGRPATAGKLTPTEQRVAELVAAGKSNHDAARALFMSPKTVEWNLSKIYKKLHVASRTELAAKLAKR
jgi:DNA-binding CsgD family transcriptional regulator